MAINRATILKDVLIHPNQAFREISENGEAFYPIAVLILIGTSIFYPLLDLVEVGFDRLAEVEIDRFVQEFIFGEIVVTFVAGLIFAGFTFLIGKKLGGVGSFKGVFSSICYSSFPLVIIGIIFIIPLTLLLVFFPNDSVYFGMFGLTSIVQFIITIWSLTLLLYAIKISHGLTWGKTVGSIILGSLITIVPYLGMIFVFQPGYFQSLFWFF